MKRRRVAEIEELRDAIVGIVTAFHRAGFQNLHIGLWRAYHAVRNVMLQHPVNTEAIRATGHHMTRCLVAAEVLLNEHAHCAGN